MKGQTPMRHSVHTNAAPSPAGPYSQAIVLDSSLVFVSGQGAADPTTGDWASSTIDGQTRQVFANIEAILKQAGCSMQDVVKVSVFLSDMADFQGMNEVYRTRFAEPYPARTTVRAGLADGLLIEVDVIAVLQPAGGDE
jgi:2-iminobutanoate/2-iminopropanoate deaminase